MCLYFWVLYAVPSNKNLSVMVLRVALLKHLVVSGDPEHRAWGRVSLGMREPGDACAWGRVSLGTFFVDRLFLL